MDLVQFVDSIGDVFPPVTDSFTRTVSGGWGTATSGEAWAVGGGLPGAYSVNGSAGLIAIDAVSSSRRAVIGPSVADVDVMSSIQMTVLPAGASLQFGVMARYLDANNYYVAELLFESGGTINLRIQRAFAGVFSEVLASTGTGLSQSTTAQYRLRFQLSGPMLRVKAWNAAGPEPAAWTGQAMDSGLTRGVVGCRAALGLGNTNTLPYTVSFDNFSVAPLTSVRLDLNDDVRWGLRYEGTDFSPPGLKEAYASTLLTDGERQTASAYANRRIKLGLDLIADSPDAVAAELAKLWRELDRDGNILKWQPQGMSKPVFFRTIRSSDNTVVDYPGDGRLRTVDVTVNAEPFAYGLRETLPSGGVSNDPAEPGPDLNSNPYFEVDASSWTASGGTAARSTAQAHEGFASLLLTPSGVAATSLVESERQPVVAGSAYRVSAWVRCAVARSVDVSAAWYTAGGAWISNTTTSVSVAANTWTVATATGTPPAGAASATVSVAMTGTPPSSNLLYVDEARLRQEGAGNGTRMDITGVKGDVETPVVLHRPTGNIGVETLFAVRRGGDPSGVPLLLQAEAMAQGTDTSTQANSTTFSGTGNNYSRVSFSTTPGYADRLTVAAYPAVASVDARGTYRVFARLRKNGTSSTIKARLRVAGLDLDEVTVTGTAVQMVDLGLMAIPTGADPVYDGPTGLALPAKGPSLALRATRIGGSDTLDVDYLLFVPADDRLAIVHWPVTSAGRVVLDGVHDLTYASAGDVTSGTPGYHVGGLPMLSPGVTNRIFIVNEVAAGAAEPAFPATATWDGHYWPRYLTVRGAS